MGKTMSEKILAKKAGLEDVRAGQIVTVQVDCAMMDDILGPRGMAPSFDACAAPVKHPERCVVICDHYAPPANIDQANIVAYTRRWARENGIDHYFESQGPCHQLLAENGFSLPGTVQVGTDSHTCTAGAFGCFGTGIGSTEMTGVVLSGEIWFRVPETVSVRWRGQLPAGVMAKDLILKTIGAIGHAGATYQALEFTGSAIEALSMDERMCISNMAVEAGAKVGLIPADEKTFAYLRDHGCEKPYTPQYSDPDAEYCRILEFDAGTLVPQVAAPHAVDNVHPIDALRGTPLQRAYLGSCTGGRLNDLRAAAELLRGKTVSKDVTFFVSPASQRIWMEADRLGYLETLAQAGAIILAPTCGACVGTHSGILADGESCISSSNRNFRGRMGSKESMLYLGSPLTVAASALEGRLADPRNYL